MADRSRRYQRCRQKVDREASYPLDEAVNLLKSMTQADFDETVELHVQLGIDPRQSDQQVRGNIALPHGVGKTRTVCVFAEGESAEEAKEAGADYVGGDDLIERVEDGWMDFDVALAVPEMMKKIGRLGRYLGPQGLMPSPKSGTVSEDIATAVQEFKAGKVEFRNDRGGNIHLPVGKISFNTGALKENIQAAVDLLLKMKPLSAKGRYLKKTVLTSTMSPAVRLAV
jgi:large subunit ribosomal protein L1